MYSADTLFLNISTSGFPIAIKIFLFLVEQFRKDEVEKPLQNPTDFA